MQTIDQSTDTAGTPARTIPPLPGGGSWRFDEPSWAWISNDPAPPAPAEQPAAAEQIPADEV